VRERRQLAAEDKPLERLVGYKVDDAPIGRWTTAVAALRGNSDTDLAAPVGNGRGTAGS